MNQKIETEMIYVKSMKPHYHEEYLEIILVLRGSLTIHKMERAVTIERGQYVIINRHVVHYVESEGAYILTCKIKLSEFKDIFERMEYVEFLSNNEARNIQNPLVKRIDGVLLDLMLNIFVFKDKVDKQEELNFYVYEIVHLLFTSYQLVSKIKDYNEFINDEAYNRYYYVVEYVFNHIHEKIVTEDVINHLYMNPTYFSQFMKKVGGVGFKELVLYRKLMYISSYLLEPKLSMYDIALKVGITDMKSFYNIFKKFYQISPAKWKMQISDIKDEYVLCQDDYILKKFIEEYHIHKHRENTISKLFKYLEHVKNTNINVAGAIIVLKPYDDMGETMDEDYQVYKFFPSLLEKLKLLNLSLCLRYPYHILANKIQCKLLIDFMNLSIIYNGTNEIRKWRIEIVVNQFEELVLADTLKIDLEKKVPDLNIQIILETI